MTSIRHLRNAAAVLFFAVLIGSSSVGLSASFCQWNEDTYMAYMGFCEDDESEGCVADCMNQWESYQGACPYLCETECSTYATGYGYIGEDPDNCQHNFSDDPPDYYHGVLWCVCYH